MKDSSELDFEILQKQPLYQGFFKLNGYQFRNQLFEGGWSESFHREIFERGHAAAVLLLDLERELVVMVEQFRPGAVETEDCPWLIEPVAGIIEPGETPESVAKREADEEAGAKVKRLRKLYDYLVSPGGTTERTWLFVGEIDSSQLPDFAGLDHEHEDIRVHKIPVSELFSRLESGQINNAMSLIALQWLQLNWPRKADIFENLHA